MKCTKCKIDKELNADNFKPRKGGRFHGSCRDCMRDANNKWDKKTNSARRKTANNWRKNLIDSHKKPCLICGESDLVVIEFHHVDERKDVGGTLVSQALRQSKKKFLEEVEKCVCLCANCHRRVHAGTVVIPA